METKTQNEVLQLLKEGLTIKAISNRRQTSIQATYKIIKKLKNKGLLLGTSGRGLILNSTSPPAKKSLIRLHGQEFNIKFKLLSINYKKIKEFKGSKIRFYNNSLEVYSKKNFFGGSGWEAHHKSVLYFKNYFAQLQNEIGILFNSIKEVSSHYADMDNPLAKDNYTKKRKLDVRSTKDGKPWLKTDYSFNISELEFVHPGTALKDTDNLLTYFNDLRDNQPLNNSQLTSRMIDLVTALEKQVLNNDQVNKILKHILSRI